MLKITERVGGESLRPIRYQQHPGDQHVTPIWANDDADKIVMNFIRNSRHPVSAIDMLGSRLLGTSNGAVVYLPSIERLHGCGLIRREPFTPWADHVLWAPRMHGVEAGLQVAICAKYTT